MCQGSNLGKQCWEGTAKGVDLHWNIDLKVVNGYRASQRQRANIKALALILSGISLLRSAQGFELVYSVTADLPSIDRTLKAPSSADEQAR